MSFMDKVKKAMLAIVLAIVALPAAFAYPLAYPNTMYGYGQPRMGAYTSTFSYNQGFYDYVSAPIAFNRYGSQYKIYNIRDPAYTNSAFARVPNIYRPYYGYPYRSYGASPTLRMQPYPC